MDTRADVNGWPAVNNWRKARRAELRQARGAVPATTRADLDARLRAHLLRGLPELAVARVGIYWPLGGEPDLRPLFAVGAESGLDSAGSTAQARAALPVVVDKRGPLEFRHWAPGAPTEPGVWNIPVPMERRVVQPAVLLVPLLGFDAAGYRLGNGGGYYDRTLAALVPRPLTVGVGYESGRLESIAPQPHDVPLDALVTEAGWHWPRSAGSRAERTTDTSSPVCYAAESAPEYFGHWSAAELALLLEEWRSEAAALLAGATGLPADAALEPCGALARGTAQACGLLARAGAAWSGGDTPAPAQSLPAAALHAALERLRVRLTAALPRVGDEAVHAVLTALDAVLAANAVRARELAGAAG